MPRQPMSEVEVERTKARILKEAATIVGESSLAELSMRSLAGRVGLTPGALYRYFPSKQSILHAYWADALADLRRRVHSIGADEGDPIAAIRRIFAVYTSFCLEDHDRFKVLFLENSQGLEDGYSHPEDLLPYEHLVERVNGAMKAGAFREADPEVVAQALWAAAHGGVTLLITETTMKLCEPADLLSTIIDNMLRGLAAQE